MPMTVLKKSLVALAAVLFFVLLVPIFVLANGFSVGFAVVPAVVVSVGYMFWALAFSCPKCSSPLLWEVKGGRKIVRLIPAGKCSKCGKSRSESYVKHTAAKR